MSEGPHLSDQELAGFIDNRLDPATRRSVIIHLDSCEECRAEWIVVAELAGKRGNAGAKGPRRTWWIPAGIAVAAGLAGLLLVRAPRTGSTEATQRAPATGTADAAPRIVAVAPRDGSSRGSDERSFTWRAVAADSYRFVLLAEDGTPLFTRDSHDTALVLPNEIALVRGRTYFWRVDALAAGITSSTGTMRLQVAP